MAIAKRRWYDDQGHHGCDRTAEKRLSSPSGSFAQGEDMTVTASSESGSATGSAEIRPFFVNIPEESIADLRRRLADTRWTDKETVADASQGVQLAKLQPLVEYWASDYDWRNVESRLNALPQFVTEIDGVDIHFIHVRSQHEDALPMIVTHGWPGSIIEMLKVIEPLTDPTAHGGSAGDAFHLVIPSLPGYGFSGRPTVTGWNPDRIATAWDTLMKRLGYDRYVAQGGDWGAVVTEKMGSQAPAGLAAIHVNLPAAVPPDIEAGLAGTGPVPEMTDEERAVFESLAQYRKAGYGGYFVAMTNRPQDIGYGLTDSPVGLAAFFLWHPGFSQWSFDDSASPTRADVLDDFSLYWLTNTLGSSSRLYWEWHGISPTSAAGIKSSEISVPVGVTVFPEDVYRAPESWVRRAYPNVLYYNQVDRGGHFAAWEQPALFTEEMRAAFRSIRY
jgi:pimeloyl-ACP methyl ester carboxylesterase